MKKLYSTAALVIVVIATLLLIQGCFKDSATRTYTIYRPLYKTVQEVRSGIAVAAATPVVHPGKIFVLGNFIFLNEIDKGVHIIDNTNPSAPVNRYFIAIPGNLDLAVKGNILYADLYRDLVTIDISNPAAIQVKKISENVFPARTYINGFAADPSRIIVDWIRKDTTVPADAVSTIQDRSGVVLFNSSVSSVNSSATVGISGSTARFTLLKDYLYTVTNSNLNVFNVSQPESPVFTSTVNAGWNIETISTFKENLFLGSTTGMFIFNTANPAQPVKLSQFQHVTSCDPVIADDDYAYVTLRSGSSCNNSSTNQLDILNIQNLQSPTLVKSYALTNPHGLSKSGNTLFICDGAGGFKVFNAANVNNVVLLQTITGLNAHDVITVNNTAIVVAEDGLYQYNITNLNNVTRLSKISYNL